MMPDTTPLARELQANLPVLSPHAASILRACEDPAIDATTFAAIVAETPTIAARLLGLANSTYYCHSQPIHALPRAIQTLGMVTVRGIALGLLIGDQFSPARCPAFDAARFWETAVLSAQLTQLLAPAVPPDRPLPHEAAYMAGLLHNIGLLALVSLRPDEMNALLAETGTSLGAQLRARLGFDHRMVAGWLAAAWHLPQPLRWVLEHCGDPDYRGESWPLAQLTGLCACRVHGMIAAAVPADETAAAAARATLLGIAPERIRANEEKLCASLDALRTTAGVLAGQNG